MTRFLSLVTQSEAHFLAVIMRHVCFFLYWIRQKIVA